MDLKRPKAMSLFQSIKRKLLPQPEVPESLLLTEARFTSCGINVPWVCVEQVKAFKLDLGTTDEVWFVFVLSSGTTVEISEEQPGFDVVLNEAQHHLPSLSGWQSKVIKPAFKRNEATLFQRSVQLGAQPEVMVPPV